MRKSRSINLAAPAGRDGDKSVILYIKKVLNRQIHYSPLRSRLKAGWTPCCGEPTDRSFTNAKKSGRPTVIMVHIEAYRRRRSAVGRFGLRPRSSLIRELEILLTRVSRAISLMRISLEAWSSRMRRPALKLYWLWDTGCGAIKGAIDHVELGNLNGLLAKIRPAVDETQYSGDRSSKNDEFVDAAAKTNVRRTIDAIRNGSNVLAPMEKDGNVASGNGCAWAKPTGQGNCMKNCLHTMGYGWGL